MDYTAAAAAMRFGGEAGEERTFTVATIEDETLEDDETFTVSLAVSDAPSGVTVGDPATGTITDDDGGRGGGGGGIGGRATVTVSDASAVEGDALTFTVTLNRAVQGGLTVTPGFADGTAVAGVDYTAAVAAMRFGGEVGEERTFTVATIEDETLEEDETFTVSLAVSDAPSGATVGDPATGTITDDDGGGTGGRATVTVSDASAVEGDALTFTVTLNREVQGGLKVTPRFADGTAVAGADYTAEASALSFAGAVGEERTFTVATIEDETLEGDETFTVSLAVLDAAAATAEDGTGTIRDDAPRARGAGAERLLYLLARSLASEAVSAVEERFTANDPETRAAPSGVLSLVAEGGSTGSWVSAIAAELGASLPSAAWTGSEPTRVGMIAGAPVDGAGAGAAGDTLGTALARPLGKLELLAGRRFAVQLGPAETPGWAHWMLWGRTAAIRSSLDVESGGRTRGDLFTGHFGFETRPRDSMLLGAAVSHSTGALGYTVQAPLPEHAVLGEGDGSMTSVQPYVHWSPRPGLALWGMGGIGGGSLTVVDSLGTADTPLGLRMFAGGGRKDLIAGGALAIKADVFRATLRSEERADLTEAVGAATRARLLLQGRTEWRASPESRVSPRVEFGARWDDGSDLSGVGAEVGGGLAYVHTRLKLGLDVQGRYLLAHQAARFKEWGAGVAVRFGPGVDGPGPWMELSPQWGAAASQASAMWSPHAGQQWRSASRGGSGSNPSQVALTAGYRLSQGSDVSVQATRDDRGAAADAGGVAVRVEGRLSW